MNRMVGWLSLDGAKVNGERLNACPFNTPHWQPDHQSIYAHGPVAMSATQRFITPECQAGLMPYCHHDSGCVINADVYLTHRETLCEVLGVGQQTADAVLILHAYLKWGEQCTHYLVGQYCFMIWDPRHQHLFVALDPFAQCPLFYLHQPGKCFILANECSAFHALCPNLTLNETRFFDFAQDIHSSTETAYQEIRKLPAGHQMVITAKRLRQTSYWRWKDHKQTLPYHTREHYYAAFEQYFERAVQGCLRGLGPLTSQLSGGLDSSAVTAQAALLLAEKQQALWAFTSAPQGLSGESYRPGWYYHELSRIEPLLAQYSNIQHRVYMATPSTDIFEKLPPLQHCFDQPLRNINNLDWTMACYEQVLAKQGRVLLIGAGGNGTISWAGRTHSENLYAFGAACKAKILRRHHRWIPNLHETLLSDRLNAPLRASVYPLQLWYGVRRLDPTQALDLAVFCYNVPAWVYRQGKHPLQQRLLTREGLGTLLPEAITQNPYRGEQGADWYLHYNVHAKHWREQLLSLPQNAQILLWQSYDRARIMRLFEEYPAINHPPDRTITRDICFHLLRCLSVGFYLNAQR
jgi:hypothetical protein